MNRLRKLSFIEFKSRLKVRVPAGKFAKVSNCEQFCKVVIHHTVVIWYCRPIDVPNSGQSATRAPETCFHSPYGKEPGKMSTTASKVIDRPCVKSIKQSEVLVVQSNPADTLLTIEALKAAGLTNGLRCVSEGKDALVYMLRKGPHANAPVPDLIFLDLSQPRMAALEVLKIVKSTPALTHIPIVVAAGSDDPEFVRSERRDAGRQRRANLRARVEIESPSMRWTDHRDIRSLDGD
jgi:CheY-like chemotaxis protein